MAVTISLCMIVRDEEEVLARCLDSVADAVDEVILVDTGSVDRTREIARAYTTKVYNYIWNDDFAAARNFSFSKATMDYCMWLDADDILLPADRRRLKELKATLSPDVDVVMLPYCLTRDKAGKPEFWYYRERIVRNAPAYRWQGQVHEAITPVGQILWQDATVTHQKLHPSDPNRNLRILEKVKNSPTGLSPREQYYYGRELKEHQRFPEAIAVLEGFLREPGGWTENKLDACLELASCYETQGRREDAYLALLRGFLLPVTPRAELCCELGRLFFEDEQLANAIFWYESALLLPYRPDSGGFVRTDCYGFLPCIWLCVCYDRMGDRERAAFYNEKAGEYKPDSREYLYNKRYFAQLHAESNFLGKENNDL